jgi:hypothetical protein
MALGPPPAVDPFITLLGTAPPIAFGLTMLSAST